MNAMMTSYEDMTHWVRYPEGVIECDNLPHLSVCVSKCPLIHSPMDL